MDEELYHLLEMEMAAQLEVQELSSPTALPGPPPEPMPAHGDAAPPTVPLERAATSVGVSRALSVPDDHDILKARNFGVFRITPKQVGHLSGGPFGGFQANCPFHKLSSVSGCRRYFAITGTSGEDRRACVRKILFWCLRARDFDRQRDHLRCDLLDEECPPLQEMWASKIVDKPRGVKTDALLDQEQGEALLAARSSGSGKRKR